MARPFGQSGYGNLKVKRAKPKAPKGKLVNQRVGSKRFGQVYREEAAKGGSFHIYGSGKDQTRVFVPGGGLMGRKGSDFGSRVNDPNRKKDGVPERQQVGTVNDPTEVAGKGSTPKKGVRPVPRSQMIESLVNAMRGQNAGRSLPTMPPSVRSQPRRPLAGGMYGRGARATTRKRKKS